MINELVIHLGDTKTGSTSIQKALLSGAYDVPGETLLYPTRSHHNALVRALNRPRRADEREKRFSKVFDRLSNSEARYGVVSAEHFQFVDPEIFVEAVETYWPGMRERMRLISYVRPHHEKLLSSFSERVKLGHAGEAFEAFLDVMSERKTLDYLPRFRKWRAVFGDRFELRPFVRGELYRQDVIQDFLRYVLGHENFTVSEDVSANTSLTIPQLSILREVHETLARRMQETERKTTPAIVEARSALGRTVNEHIDAKGLGRGGKTYLLPARLADGVRQRYAEDAAALDAEFFSGTPMSDALANISRKTTTERQSLNMKDHFSPETVAAVQALGTVLTGMLLKDPKAFLTQASSTRLMFSD